jgi:hypothetical protein
MEPLSTLHYILQSLSNMPKTSYEILNDLTNLYEQLRIIVRDPISLLGARMLNDVDNKVWDVKHVQNKYIGNVDVIFCGDFFPSSTITRCVDIQENIARRF